LRGVIKLALWLLRVAVWVYCPLPAAAPPVNSATPCGEARLGLASVSVMVRVRVEGLGLGFRVQGKG